MTEPLPQCHGCRLCDLACPAWRFSRDVECGPRAITRYHQRGQPIDAKQTEHCTLCAACDAACPLGLQPMATILTQLAGQKTVQSINMTATATTETTMLWSDNPSLRAHFPHAQPLADGGKDIRQALRAGEPISAAQLRQFLAPLAAAKQVIIDDGLCYYAVRRWLPKAHLSTLAEALLPQQMQQLRSGDLLLLDATGFNADQARLLPIMQRFAHQRGLVLNLDLQRLAMPLHGYIRSSNSHAAAQERWQWLVKGKKIQRIIAERREDVPLAATISGLPAIWIADLNQ
ncbi:MAG: (Fe-S)-binding protein [Mariprofundales bacterium]